MERQKIENQVLQTCALFADHCNDKTQDPDLKRKYVASLKKTVDLYATSRGGEQAEGISRVYQICNRYESGFGHGLKRDGLDLSKTPHSDPELGEAYQIGYEEGFERHIAGDKPEPTGSSSPAPSCEQAAKIVTEFINPPIPVRDFDWSARFDGYEPGDPIGHGSTKAEAITALKEQV